MKAHSLFEGVLCTGLVLAVISTSSTASGQSQDNIGIFLDGISSYITLPNEQIGDPFSIEMWVFAVDPAVGGVLWNTGSSFESRIVLDQGSPDDGTLGKMRLVIEDNGRVYSTSTPDDIPKVCIVSRGG